MGGRGGVGGDCGWKVVVGGALVDSNVASLLRGQEKEVDTLHPSPCRHGDKLDLSPSSEVSGDDQWKRCVDKGCGGRLWSNAAELSLTLSG